MIIKIIYDEYKQFELINKRLKSVLLHLNKRVITSEQFDN
jgi:hypothetical protein